MTYRRLNILNPIIIPMIFPVLSLLYPYIVGQPPNCIQLLMVKSVKSLFPIPYLPTSSGHSQLVTIPAPWSICQWLKVRWHHSPRRPPCLRKSVRRIAISRSKGVLRGRGRARSVVPPWSESIAKLVPQKNNFNLTIWFVLAMYGDISIVFMGFNRPIYNARWFLLVIYRTD